WEKQKGSRGIRRGQWYRLVFQFPIRELCTIDEAEQRLTDQDKPKKAVKMTPIVHKVIVLT
ncbi:hypothetical protein, partial [Acinetobacter baumannii]|uniref:hypothetical protein n=1 Tax=Acinetobacter baumannii TaxID=470 RepID=UPI003CC7EC9F